MKVCKVCGVAKSLDNYHKYKKMASGYLNQCKDCVKEYREKNKEHRKEQMKEWYEQNKEHRKEYQKEHNNSLRLGIYLITNLVNGRKYIGAGKIKQRLWCHKNSSSNKLLRKDIETLGADNFTFKPLLYCEKKYLDTLERYFIQKYHSSYDDYNGYNLQSGGKKGFKKSKITYNFL